MKPPSITIELLGVARLLAGRETIELPYPAEATVGGLVRALAEELPALVGTVIRVDTPGLVDGFALTLDGRVWTADSNAPLGASRWAALLSSVAGGNRSG